MKLSFQFSIILFLVSATAFGQTPVKRILLEEFSTAPCGFCPDGDVIAAKLVSDHPNVIWVTHHAGFGTDSMTITASSTIAGAFTTFAPGACLNRGDYPVPIYTMPPYIAVSRQRWDSLTVAHENDPPVMTVELSNAYDPATRKLNCTVDASFISAPPAGDLRLNVFIVEDSVVGYGKGYDQTNYFNTTPGHPCNGKGDPIVGYVHHRVLRAVPTSAWGLSGVIPSAPEAGKTYSYTVANIPISPKWKYNDIDIIAFVSYFNAEPKLRQILNSNSNRLNDATTSIDPASSAAEIFQISVHPNPASDRIFVRHSLSNETNARMLITDNIGRTVKSVSLNANSGSHTVSVHDLPSGMYFYRVYSGTSHSISGKFTIAR